MKNRNLINAAMYLIIVAIFMALPNTVVAHVSVTPAQVGIASVQTFTISVPNEKDTDTIGLRLLLPDGLKDVMPNVAPGWTVTVKREGGGEAAKATEISWTNGIIPVGQRAEFVFAAHVPAQEGVLRWKSYQTYKDGTMISWDHDPKQSSSSAEDSDENPASAPFSTTRVINDIRPEISALQQSQFPLHLSVAAIALSVLALGMAWRKR